MKKIIALLAFVPIVAAAQTSMSLSYGLKELDANTKNHQTVLSVKTAVAENFAVDVVYNNDVADVSNTVTLRMELGLNYSYSLNDWAKATLRTAIAQKQKSGSSPFPYYVIEPGIDFKLPADFTARIAYRYRNAIEEINNDRSHTMRYAVGYNLTKSDKIDVGYDITKGDGACVTTSVKYTRSF